MSVVETSAKALCAAMLLCACGGHVNLGEREASGAQPPADSNASPDDPPQVPSTRELPLRFGESRNSLAVFGDFLYFVLKPDKGPTGLHRCQKADCARSMTRLLDTNDNLYTLGVYEDRLVVTGGDDDAWIGSYALPDATDKQVVIDQLPLSDQTKPTFHRGYAYWPLALDSGLYRCALPDCAGGPTHLSDSDEGPNSGIEVDGKLLFALDSTSIVRIAELGDGTVERLEPDATLSPAPAESDRSGSGLSSVTQIRAHDGKLYAISTCIDCPETIVRWPVAGGAREDLFETREAINDFFVFGAELVWLSLIQRDPSRATLTTCRVEACSVTLRRLGQVRSDLRGITADDERLYWLEAARVDANVSAVAIRSVSLLPPP